MTGRTLAHYQIVEKLGEGGMGVVYKARDLHLDRFVALKLLPPGKLADPERKRRFVQEAKSASALNHPNIIHVYDINDSEGVPFLAMEYVSGKTLGQRIGRKGLPLDVALKYGIQIADALAKAHTAGIIHRDLKPSNLMVTDDGLIKVLDFGLAKLIDQGVSHQFDETRSMGMDAVQTEEGVIVGTVEYMSPEQAEGKSVDGRSDIFSLGAVLYEMFSGKRAFHGESPLATLTQVLNQEPTPLHEIAAGIPVELEKLVARCLRKDPERRFQSMPDLRVALAELKEASESGLPAPAAPAVKLPAASRRRWWALAAMIGVAAAGLFWFFRPSSAIRESALKEAPLTTYPGFEDSPSFSPDGNQIAFAWNGEKQDNFDIYVKLIGPGAPLRLTTNPADDGWPAWSPDGRTIAFLRDLGAGNFGVFVIPALGGPERKLLDTVVPNTGWISGPYLAWLPDSKGIIFTHKDSPEHPSSLFLLRIDSGERRQLTFAPAGSVGDCAPALSPDGSNLVFLRATGVGPRDLYLLALNTALVPAGEPKRITFDNTIVEGVAWTSSGRDIVFSSERAGGGLWRIALPRLGGSPGEPQRLDRTKGSSPAISRQGHRLAYAVASEGDLDIWRVQIPDWRKSGGANAPAKFMSSTHAEFAPQFSPDGMKLAFESDRSGSLEIWVCASDGSNCGQLTSFGGSLTGLPHWSPDGQRISFYSRVEDKARILIMSAEGGALQRLTNDASDNMFSNWSRDGRCIYFSSNRSGMDQIWKMPSNGGTAVQVTRSGGFAVTESPDGKYVYYTRSKDENTSLWRMPAEGGPEALVLKSVVLVNYAVTDHGVYYMTQPDLHANKKLIQFLSFDDQTTKMIASTDLDVYAGLAVSPDEHWLLYAQRKPESSDLMLVENFE